MTTYAIVSKKELAKVIMLIDKLDTQLQKIEKTIAEAVKE